MISYNSLSTTDCNIRYGVAILQTRTTSSREKATTTTYEQLGFSIISTHVQRTKHDMSLKTRPGGWVVIVG